MKINNVYVPCWIDKYSQLMLIVTLFHHTLVFELILFFAEPLEM